MYIQVTLHDGWNENCDPFPQWSGTLAEFLTDQEFSIEDVFEIVNDLWQEDQHKFGGGAAPETTLKLVPISAAKGASK